MFRCFSFPVHASMCFTLYLRSACFYAFHCLLRACLYALHCLLRACLYAFRGKWLGTPLCISLCIFPAHAPTLLNVGRPAQACLIAFSVYFLCTCVCVLRSVFASRQTPASPSLTALPVGCLCRSRAHLLVGCSLSFRPPLSCRSLHTCSARSPFGGSDSPFPSPIALAGAVAASTPLATTVQLVAEPRLPSRASGRSGLPLGGRSSHGQLTPCRQEPRGSTASMTGALRLSPTGSPFGAELR